MSSLLHVQTIGQGQDIVMLHGWGVNSAVFTPLHNALSNYRVHYIDLPGFGHSEAISGNINDWVDAIIDIAPDNAIWLGWSLGGLLASLAAIRAPKRVKALVTVASSPCFLAKEIESWPGIAPHVLNQFGQQLAQNQHKTIEQFLAIQAMGSESAKSDIKQLKALVFAKPAAQESSLLQGLSMLQDVDIRSQVAHIQKPWLRMWGRLDGLVPRKLPPLMPNSLLSADVIFKKASHAPFISHPELFVTELTTWIEAL